MHWQQLTAPHFRRLYDYEFLICLFFESVIVNIHFIFRFISHSCVSFLQSVEFIAYIWCTVEMPITIHHIATSESMYTPAQHPHDALQYVGIVESKKTVSPKLGEAIIDLITLRPTLLHSWVVTHQRQTNAFIFIRPYFHLHSFIYSLFSDCQFAGAIFWMYCVENAMFSISQTQIQL